MEYIIKLSHILLFLISINSYGEVCFDNKVYDEGTTCDEVKPLTQLNPLIVKLNNERQNDISSELGMLVFEKIKKHHEELGKLELLASITGSGTIGDVPQCNIDSILSSHSCGDDISKILFSEVKKADGTQVNSSSEMKDYMGNFFVSQFSADISNDAINCSNPAILNRRQWAGFINDTNDDVNSFIDEIKRVSSGTEGNSDSVNEIYQKIRTLYPDFWEDISSKTLILPSDADSSNGIEGILKSIFDDENNKESLRKKLSTNCTNMRTLLNDVQCKPINSGKLTNDFLSMRLFNFSTNDQIQSFSSSIASDVNFEDPEESFMNFAVNCIGLGCNDDSCLDVDSLFLDDGSLSDYKKLHDEITRQKNSSNNSSSLSSDQDVRSMQQDCIKMNCSNYNAVIADNSVSCTSRESRDIASLQTEFSCSEAGGEHASVCQTLEIVHRSKSTPRRSAFVNSILGTTSDPSEEPKVVENVELGTGEGEDELDTAYDRGERNDVIKRSQNLASNNSGRRSSTKRSKERSPRTRVRVAEASTNNTASGLQDIFNRQNYLAVNNNDLSDQEEEEYTEEEVGVINSLRNAITGTFDSISDYTKQLITPKNQRTQTSRPTRTSRNRIGESVATSSNEDVPTSFQDDFRDNYFGDNALPPGDSPEGIAEVERANRAQGVRRSGASSVSSQGISGGTTGAVPPGQPRNIGLTADDQDNLVPSIVLNAADLSTLDIDEIRKLDISPDRPFLILVDIGGGKKLPVRVTRDDEGLVPRLRDEDRQYLDQLRQAPIFANYFSREVERIDKYRGTVREVLQNRS